MKNAVFAFLIALTVLLVGSIGCSAGGVKEQKNIATACAGITAAGNAIAAAAETDPAKKPLAAKAVILVRPTVPFCEPKPADHLSPADYAALLSAAADLATMKKEIQ